MAAEQGIVLSISLLASDRKDTIRRCLDSLKPIMEQIPSELILVDTSKDPEIHKILLEYTDQVIEFEWCKDFAKARNAGLKLAKGEWFLYLDDDEWFVEIDELISFFQSGEYREYGGADYIQRNFYDQSYINYSDSWASRMIRRDEDTHFKSKIHEYLEPLRGKCKYLHAVVNHSGYIFVTKEDKMRHFERNYTLLQEMAKEEPDEFRWKVQIVQEYRSVKKWEDMYSYCCECLEQAADIDNKWRNYDIGTFYAGAAESLLFLKRYDESLAMCQKAISDKRSSELCHIYMEICRSTNYYWQGNWTLAEESAQRYLRMAKKFQKDPEKMTEQRTAILVGEAVDQIPTKRAYSVCICCGLKRGNTTNLRKYLKKLEWDQPVIYAFDDMAAALLDAAEQLPEEDILIEAMQLAWNNSDLRKKILHRLTDAVTQDEERFLKLLKILSKIKGEHWYLWYAKIQTAAHEGDTSHLKEDIRELAHKVENIFRMPQEVIRIAKKYEVDLEEIFLEIPFAEWTQQLRSYLYDAGLSGISNLEQTLCGQKTREDIRYDYTMMRIAETRVLFSAQDADYENKRKVLVEFGERTGTLYRTYYQGEILEKYPELLPRYAQAGLLIEKAFAAEQEDVKTALEYLKQAVEVYKPFADAIKTYLNAYGEEQERRERTRKEELRKLERQIKAEAVKCMESGQYEEALQILTQLKQIKPNDLEIVELSLRARLAML